MFADGIAFLSLYDAERKARIVCNS